MLTKQDVIDLAVDVEAAMANAGASGTGMAELAISYVGLRSDLAEGDEGRDFAEAMRALANERNRCTHKLIDKTTGRAGRYRPTQDALKAAIKAGTFALSRIVNGANGNGEVRSRECQTLHPDWCVTQLIQMMTDQIHARAGEGGNCSTDASLNQRSKNFKAAMARARLSGAPRSALLKMALDDIKRSDQDN